MTRVISLRESHLALFAPNPASEMETIGPMRHASAYGNSSVMNKHYVKQQFSLCFQV